MELFIKEKRAKNMDCFLKFTKLPDVDPKTGEIDPETDEEKDEKSNASEVIGGAKK